MKAHPYHQGIKSSEWIWPLLACIVGWRFIALHLDAPILIDPLYTYLPAARAFLDQGWSFFLTPESYHVTPLAYLWPALWGVDPTWIRIANMGLWGGCVWFLWRTSRLIGGHRAGIVAMLLLLYPELVRYFPSEMTEPIYLFGIFGWLYAIARILINHERSIFVMAQAAIMLTITLLSRPVLQLIAPAIILACWSTLAYWAIARKLEKQTWGTAWHQRTSTITWGISLGLILPLALVVKNGITFGLWGLGTGSGIGLYLGTHPLFQGAEPAFLGFGFDVNTLVALSTHSGNPLSLVSDQAIRQAALWNIQSMSVTEVVVFFSRKLWWWLAHHPAQIDSFGSALRKIRLFELITLTTCIVWLAYRMFRRYRGASCAAEPKSSVITATQSSQLAFAAFLLAIFLTMLAQLLPILYNSRYSSVLLDPLLILLTAFSVACLTSSVRFQFSCRKNCWRFRLTSHQGVGIWPVITLIIAIPVTTLITNNLVRNREHNVVDPMQMGKTLPHLHITARDRIQTYGLEIKGDYAWRVTESPAALQVNLKKNDIEKIFSANLFNALWSTEIALHSDGKRCEGAEISYQTHDGKILQPHYKRPLLLPLKTDGLFTNLVTHANHELRPNIPGSLRIVLHCPVGTLVQWRSTELLESRHAWDAAAHITH